jgi:RNA polymerase sigma-70 factor, ECF subfamily
MWSFFLCGQRISTLPGLSLFWRLLISFGAFLGWRSRLAVEARGRGWRPGVPRPGARRSRGLAGRRRKEFDCARRSDGGPDDYEDVTPPQVWPDPAFGLLKLYDEALPHVYGYLLARCGDTGLAEDLAAESFLAAIHAIRKPDAPDPSIPWLIGVARHKLADHWRRVEREQRGLRVLGALGALGALDSAPACAEDPWEAVLDRIRSREVLARLGEHHRAALTLRYLDGLPVPEVARHLDRTLHATEALLVRARAAFRRLYEAQEGSR